MQTVASAYDSPLTNNAHEAHITNVDNGNGKRFPLFRCDSTAKYRSVRTVRPVRSVRTCPFRTYLATDGFYVTDVT